MAKREGIWFVAEFDGHRGVICKAKGKELTPTVRNDILSAKHKLEMEKVFDFFSPLRPIPMGVDQNGQTVMGIGRESIVTGNHFVTDPAPSYVNMNLVTKLTFFDDMSAFDQARYSEWITQAEVNLEAQRRAASPLHMPGPARDVNVPVKPGGILDIEAIRRQGA